MDISFIDLFCGVGGFRLALEAHGAKCVFSSEIDEKARRTYLANFREEPHGDITLDEVQDKIQAHDVLCAGFPCQAFSIAGNQKGFDDIRGNLFFEIEKIAKKHRPKVIFLENVKNLISHDRGRTFRIILEALERTGYDVFYKVLDTAKVANIPQHRERVFIVAFDKKLNVKEFNFPCGQKLTTTLEDMLEESMVAKKYYYTEKSTYYPTLSREIITKYECYQWRRTYARKNMSGLCPTLTANMGTGGHNVPIVRDDFGIRKLTPMECFSLQGFPRSFLFNNYLFSNKISDTQLYKQAGNSVTVPVVSAVFAEIKRVLQEAKNS